MRIGYARVSTEDQTLDLQRDALKRAKCGEVYEEQATGKNTSRPQLEACIKSLREGDTLIVWRLDRLGRNLADLVGLVAEFERRKINFESLTEKIETVSPAGRLVFHVFAALAEFERNLIRERTVAGLKAARARGRMGGRPAKLSAKEIKTIRALL
jgi:DNA invertase Pin-like site-specific DNA recombinase